MSWHLCELWLIDSDIDPSRHPFVNSLLGLINQPKFCQTVSNPIQMLSEPSDETYPKEAEHHL